MDTYGHDGYREDPFATLSPTVRFQRNLSQVQSDAILEIDRNALSKRPEDRNILLAPIINTCLSRLAALTAECDSMLG
jgi:hypothetical protein